MKSIYFCYMNISFLKSPRVIFVISFVLMVIISLIPQIELYECHFYYSDGVQELDFKKNMSLSYFLGYGYDMEALSLYQTIDFTWKGKLMFFLLLLGFPLLVSYRFALRNKLNNQKDIKQNMNHRVNEMALECQ